MSGLTDILDQIRALWRRDRRMCRLYFLLSVLLLSGSPASAAEESTLSVEYRIKAAFLYNFTRFTEWPDKVWINKNTLDLCVIGRDPFGSALDSIAGKIVRDRTIVIRRLNARQNYLGCQVVFVSRSEMLRLPKILENIGAMPILTISELNGFTRAGGVIYLTVVNNKVRFEINVDAAERVGLSISSKLLNLADIVGGKPR